MLDSSTAISTLRPSIQIDGEHVAGLENTLISLMVEETTAGLYRCELRLENWQSQGQRGGYRYFERDIIDFGRELSILIGETPQQSQTLFQGRIMAVEGEFPAGKRPEIVVLAEDRFQDLRMTRRSRSFEAMTDGEIITQVAEDHGLSVESALNTIQAVHEVVVQANQSDLAFIRERARRINALLRVVGDQVLLIALPGIAGEGLQLRYGQELKHFRVLADLAQQRTKLHVTGWDVVQKEAIDSTAGHEAIQGELLDGISGSAILYDVVGEREDYIVHQAPMTQPEAQASATNRYLEQARSFVRGGGSASGDPRIRAGFPLDLRGLGKLFDGVYYVTRAVHRFDVQNGYVTDFEVERPAIGRLYLKDDDEDPPYVAVQPDDDSPDSVEAAQPGLPGKRSKSSKKPAKERKS